MIITTCALCGQIKVAPHVCPGTYYAQHIKRARLLVKVQLIMEKGGSL